LGEQSHLGHNRWHPDIPPVLTVDPGETVVIECLDGLDGQFTRRSTTDDIENLVVQRIHPLGGPIAVRGAEPGDLLAVEILDVRSSDFGVSAIVPNFGFLREDFPAPFLTRWNIEGEFATSPDLPRVRIRRQPFMGVMGVAPSPSLLATITRREAAVQAEGGLVLLPDSRWAVPGVEPIASQGLRTCPPRECGGNVDIRALTTGTTVLIPVMVPGALFSTGDGHFAQGDGEVCGMAIETANDVTLRLDVRKGLAADRGIRSVQFECSDDPRSPATRPPTRYYVTTGLPLAPDGRTVPEDVTLAAKNALRSMIDHLVAAYGYSREQAYILTSVSVDLRISQAVDVPHPLVSAFLPLDVFTE